MSRSQRLTFLGIAVLIAVVAIFVLADSSEDASTDAEQSAATATPTPEATQPPQEASPQDTPEATPEPSPEPPPLLRAGEVTRLEFTEGERARFRVRSPTLEEIHVHGYDIYRDIPPGEAVTVSFPADITGIFEIELHNSGEQIAELRVQPG